MNDSIVRLGYTNITAYIEEILDKLNKDGKEFTHVVGIARGGLIPAVIISHKLDIPMLTYSVSSYKGKTRHTINVTQGGGLLSKLEKDHKILIVDDICDSGHTIDHMRSLLSEYDITVATLVARPKTRYMVDYSTPFGIDDRWVQFPWEV